MGILDWIFGKKSDNFDNWLDERIKKDKQRIKNRGGKSLTSYEGLNKQENKKIDKLKANDYFKKSLEHLNLGTQLDPLSTSGTKEIKKGIKLLDKAIIIESTSALYYYNRGTAKKMILDYKSAIIDFNKALKLKFDKPEMIYFNLAMSKLHTNDFKGSREYNRKAESLGYDEYQIHQLDDWLDEVEENGYESLMERYD